MVEKQSNNQKGGKRPGAGRKKGEPNKRTAEAVAQAEATGIMPVDYLLSVMRDEINEQRERVAAAIAAAPYVHAKLSSIDAKITGADGGPLQMNWTIELVSPEDEG